MSKREKILVGLSLVAVIYGIYIWFLSSPQQAATAFGDNDQKALKAFILKVAEQTSRRLSKSQAYVLGKAESQWKQDPLIQMFVVPVQKDFRVSPDSIV